MISENTISKVRELDILDVLKPYVCLEKKGSNYVGKCPFHTERTGSFTVHSCKNLFHCFSCQRGGDSIKFIMEKENLSFIDAITFLAREHNIPIETIDDEKSEEELKELRHRESLLVTMEIIHGFYTDIMRSSYDNETEKARTYAYNRWPEEFCHLSGIGYAPSDSNLLFQFIKQKALSEELLLELGILRKSETGRVYPLFRERIMIPIKDKWGRTIAFTGRYIGNKDNKHKYVNSTNSLIYTKSQSLFGIDQVSRNKNDYLIIVEGAPDVLRLQSIGLNNVVAPLGTAWNESQFDQLKKNTQALCFIPDSDYVEDEPFGPGFKSVMKNGTLAIKKGFNVTVREIPFSENKLDDNHDSTNHEELENSDKRTEHKLCKNDPDSYILDKEIYSSLEEKLFIIWLAAKRFSVVDSLIEERKIVSEIADLLRYVEDQLIFDQCIEQLSKIYGRTKLWKDAVATARVEARKRSDGKSLMDERQKDVELLRRFNLFIRENCYYINGKEDEEPIRISNFIMEPLYHIEDDNNGSRIFRLRNMNQESRVIELRESEMCSLNAFQQRVGSLGNYVWPSKIDKLNRVKEYLYSKTRTAERIRKLGWDDINDFYAFGNGIFQDGLFK